MSSTIDTLLKTYVFTVIGVGSAIVTARIVAPPMHSKVEQVQYAGQGYVIGKGRHEKYCFGDFNKDGQADIAFTSPGVRDVLLREESVLRRPFVPIDDARLEDAERTDALTRSYVLCPSRS